MFLGSLMARSSPLNPDHDKDAWTGRFTCKAEIDEYLDGDTLHCLLCWEGGFQDLRYHLRGKHGMLPREYKKRFGLDKRGLANRAIRDRFAEQARERVLSGRSPRSIPPPIDWDGFLDRLRVGESIKQLMSQPGMPCENRLMKEKRNNPAFRAKLDPIMEVRPGRPIPQTVLLQVAEALKTGQSVRTMEFLTPSRRSSIYRRRQADPAFATLVRPFWFPTRNPLFRTRSHAARKFDRLAPERFKEQFNAALRSDEIYAAVHSATKGLPWEIRDDVAGDLVVAVLDGEVRIDDLPKAVARYRTAHNRMFGGYAPSLDADLGNGFTLGNSMVAAYI